MLSQAASQSLGNLPRSMSTLWLVSVCCLISVACAFSVDTIKFDTPDDHEKDQVMNHRLISAFFTPQEQECFKEEKFLYEPDKQCYTLLTTGPCTCKSGNRGRQSSCGDGREQWLVLEQLPNGRLRAACRPCPCCDRSLTVYMPSVSKCHHRIEDRSRFCPFNGTELRHNEFGEGECACQKSPPHASLLGASDGTCYPLFSRGPCRSGETLIPYRDPQTLEPVGRCAPNPCAHKGEGFAQWKDGECYQLGSQGPCDTQSKFNIQKTSRIPDCIQSTFAILRPKDFPTDSINLPKVDKNFALDLLSSRGKRRASKH